MDGLGGVVSGLLVFVFIAVSIFDVVQKTRKAAKRAEDARHQDAQKAENDRVNALINQQKQGIDTQKQPGLNYILSVGKPLPKAQSGLRPSTYGNRISDNSEFGRMRSAESYEGQLVRSAPALGKEGFVSTEGQSVKRFPSLSSEGIWGLEGSDTTGEGREIAPNFKSEGKTLPENTDRHCSLPDAHKDAYEEHFEEHDAFAALRGTAFDDMNDIEKIIVFGEAINSRGGHRPSAYRS